MEPGSGTNCRKPCTFNQIQNLHLNSIYNINNFCSNHAAKQTECKTSNKTVKIIKNRNNTNNYTGSSQ